MQSQENLEKENNVKEEDDDDDCNDSDEKDSDDDIDFPVGCLRYCIDSNLTEPTKYYLAKNPDVDFRHRGGIYIIWAVRNNNAELLQLYIETLQRNYIDKKQKESEIAGHLARFKLRKYLQKGLEEIEGYDDNYDDVLAVLKKYIPIDDSELERNQDIENDFPKNMKPLPDLNN